MTEEKCVDNTKGAARKLLFSQREPEPGNNIKTVSNLKKRVRLLQG